VGPIVGTRTDLREVFGLHAAGKTVAMLEIRPLDEVNQAIADVEAGRIAARVVPEAGRRSGALVPRAPERSKDVTRGSRR
jgi:hypothetical protein